MALVGPALRGLAGGPGSCFVGVGPEGGCVEASGLDAGVACAGADGDEGGIAGVAQDTQAVGEAFTDVQVVGCGLELAAPEEAVEGACSVGAFVGVVRPVAGFAAGLVDGDELYFAGGRGWVVEGAHCHDEGAGGGAAGAAAGEFGMVAGEPADCCGQWLGGGPEAALREPLRCRVLWGGPGRRCMRRGPQFGGVGVRISALARP